MKAWIDRGGRLMYMGANGWYWRIAFHEELPGVIEVRRAEDGIRTWIAEPGEYYHSFNGEFGGLWRRIGRAAQRDVRRRLHRPGLRRLVSYYRRAPDADNPRAAFIFEGVPDEIIGDFGLIGGGAAGHRARLHHHRSRLAAQHAAARLVGESFAADDAGQRGVRRGAAQSRRRPERHGCAPTWPSARLPSGGALFAISSIAWCGSLSHNGYDNNVSRITRNVLGRFLDEKPF